MMPTVPISLAPDQAALWFLGQAGYLLAAGDVTLAIDPYLSDSVGRIAPEFARLYPPPLTPEQLRADIIVITHDHLDHLDPDTLGAYRHKQGTLFIAPRLACRKLAALGLPESQVRRVDSGETFTWRNVEIRGIYAVPTGADVLDTTGYRIQWPNGRSVYHTSDTAFSELLLAAAPQAEVLLTCINGKWGNLNPVQAVELAARVQPRFAIPNHYDLMALNAENPETFRDLLRTRCPTLESPLLKVMAPFVWGAQGGAV